MSIDIDNFIREQKSKIASERQYLSNPNLAIKKSDHKFKVDSTNFNKKFSIDNLNEDNFIHKMKEGEQMKSRYKQELKNDFSNTNEFSKRMEFSPRRERIVNDGDNDGILPGLNYSNSAAKRKEQLRNQEYNEFKRINEENFKNRYSDKKSSRKDIKSSNTSNLQRNPITFELNDSSPRQKPSVPSRSPSPTNYFDKELYNKNFESKLDQLEKKVEDLRNFKGPQEFSKQDSGLFHSMDVVKPSRKPMRSLQDAERKLKELETQYDTSKSRFLKSQRSLGSKSKFPSVILDDELILETGLGPTEKQSLFDTKSAPTQHSQSIIPLGKPDEEVMKRRKQDQYRRDLENQMKEKSKKQNNSFDESKSFIDLLPSNNKINTVYSARREPPVSDLNNEYLYYASHNPLDFEISGYIPSTAPTNQGSKPLDAFNFPSEKSSQKISQKENYADELKKQIEERKMQKELNKKRQEEYERRKNEEISNYDPFGRGGGGAPLKGSRGEVISDLKNLKFDTNHIAIPPIEYRPKFEEREKPPTFRSEPVASEPKTYARGGHGIFGQALSEEEKIKAESYKEQLKVQIENNKRKKELEKENERIREEKEREKFEREQKQIQLELESEKKVKQLKEIDRIQKFEESKLAAKENRLKEKPDRKKSLEIKKPSPSPYQRRETPPVRSPSPPIHRFRDPLPSQRDNWEMISNFQSLKTKLGTEMALLEKELAHQNEQVEIYDPRLMKPKPPSDKRAANDFNSNVFQAVLDHKGPLSVRRGQTKPRNQSDQSSFNTEADLDEHLRQQEKVLERMNRQNFSRFELSMQEMEPRNLGLRPQSQLSNQLESDTKFIGFDQSREFPLKTSLSDISNNEFSFMKSRSPKPARVQSEFGSNTSLNIDEITRKNQQRLRKLQKIQSENERDQSSEEILNRIMYSHGNET